MAEIWNSLLPDLTALGLRAGDRLLVHASLRAIGTFPRRAERVTEALIEALGPGGTLLMPALSYETVTPEQPVFSVTETPSCVGGLSEYFRLRPETRRSLHPTHSVCGRGPLTGTLLDGHRHDHTPCGPHSPFRKLRDAGGKLLFLGCGLRPNTSMHGVEELEPPPYLFGPRVTYTLKTADGQTLQRAYLTHDFAHTVQRYDRVLALLDQEDYTRGRVGEAEAFLIEAGALWAKAQARISKDPLFFVDRETPRA